MALSQEEMVTIKHKVLGGGEAADRWNDALNALHAFAQRSGALPGEDVIGWFAKKTTEYQSAMSAAISAAAPK